MAPGPAGLQQKVNHVPPQHAAPFSEDASLRLRGILKAPEGLNSSIIGQPAPSAAGHSASSATGQQASPATGQPASSTTAQPKTSTTGKPAQKRQIYYDDMTKLSVNRLEKIASSFWLAGRPYRDPITKAALHKLKAHGFEFVIFEDAELHLLWSDQKIFIKPLPACLLDYDFWEENLSVTDAKNDADHKEIVHGALGILLSYVWLIRWQSDLRLAQENGLLSEDIKYDAWMEFTSSVLKTFKRSQVEKAWLSWRYDFAEMRLQRINFAWRARHPFNLQSLIRGFSFRYRVYGSFFERNFGAVLVVFIYLTIVLTAMQLGLATTDLPTDSRFQQACLGFAVFCILVPVIMVGLMLLLLIVFFLFNLAATRSHLRDVRKDGIPMAGPSNAP